MLADPVFPIDQASAQDRRIDVQRFARRVEAKGVPSQVRVEDPALRFEV